MGLGWEGLGGLVRLGGSGGFRVVLGVGESRWLASWAGLPARLSVARLSLLLQLFLHPLLFLL